MFDLITTIVAQQDPGQAVIDALTQVWLYVAQVITQTIHTSLP